MGGTDLIPINKASGYSAPELLEFLDYIERKALVKKGTVVTWRKAVKRFLSMLEESDPAYMDVRSLDVDHTAERIMNQGAEFKPSSMKVYMSRVRTAISEFESYKENLMEYKPGIVQREPKRVQKLGSTDDNAATGSAEATDQKEAAASARSDRITVPIPVRDGVIVQVANLPFDLSAAEADKIGRVIKAMATTSE